MDRSGGRARHSGDLIAALSGRSPARNLHSDVLWELGLAIVSGQFAEGEILPPDSDLLDRFGVSRTVLREALKTLAAKGLIEARARIGTRVLPRNRWNLFDADVLAWFFELGPEVGFLRSLAEVRIGIEIEAAALAAERCKAEDAARLIEWVDKMARSETPADFARYDLEFHRVVAEASGNPFMASISALVEMALTAAFTISSPVNDPVALEVTVGVHRRIAEAIRDGDSHAARLAMRDAISQGFDRAAGRMEKSV
ncbi:DNA-binding FadR family transcriptional regulator [Devosia subaequoris]|uniref:DNA-binding FadR family transcriptional regulator n=1 Tax=Devosia subaequoris TaxID=395930 RepID=A0A7W6IMQ5_9HYPH|nr:FadR/GntR family transcriptional regulator [Devosia subaequoris]MBB4052458.1 DNA-binding FadR family transcriptional regulator [Devosia subaequoris]MCP1209618.1 FadR family transcriptional regulator [Devosia subaequoris]